MPEKTWKEILEKFSKLPPPTIEKTEQCYHVKLTKIIKDDFTYQCDACYCLFDIFGESMYTPEQYAIKSATINLHMVDQPTTVARIKPIMDELQKQLLIDKTKKAIDEL